MQGKHADLQVHSMPNSELLLYRNNPQALSTTSLGNLKVHHCWVVKKSHLIGPIWMHKVLILIVVRSAVAVSQVASANKVSSPGITTDLFSAVPLARMVCQLRPVLPPSFCKGLAFPAYSTHKARGHQLAYVTAFFLTTVACKQFWPWRPDRIVES